MIWLQLDDSGSGSWIAIGSRSSLLQTFIDDGYRAQCANTPMGRLRMLRILQYENSGKQHLEIELVLTSNTIVNGDERAEVVVDSYGSRFDAAQSASARRSAALAVARLKHKVGATLLYCRFCDAVFPAADAHFIKTKH